MKRIGPKTPVRWHLKEWRLHLGLTQEQVAERAHTNKGQIAKLENGKQRMNDRWIAAFSHAFDITPARLLMHPETPTADDLLLGASKEEVNAVRTTVSMMLKKAS
jgi:transcriptional regulator with XRE-family HTH domain